jgi:predicted RNA-binding Zn ribbon-like protein
VQSFINSNYDVEHDHGAELLGSPAALGSWLERHDLCSGGGGESGGGVNAADLERAITVREGLRALLVAKHEPAGERTDQAAIDALNHAAADLPSTVRLGLDAPQFVARDSTAGSALGLILSYAAAAMLDGTWARLKACRECSWAFYDHSRNGAGRWCSMAVCGGRVKQRAYYSRQAES